MALTDEYIAALIPLSRAFEAYAKVAGHSPVLVGGAATAIYTAGLFPSGDFDVVAASDDIFSAVMLDQGFIREDRTGKLKIGFYHPDHLKFGYQQVTGPLFDGRADATKLIRMVMTDEGDAIVLPAIEDMIADRLAQHSVASPTDDSRLRQARTLFELAANLDVPYLRKRVCDEAGDLTLLGL